VAGWMSTPGFARPALPHAMLLHANPGAGSRLAGAPGQIELSFSQELEPAFCAIQTVDANGQDVDAAPATVDGAHLRALLKPLGPGVYRVRWHAVSVDTHRTEGAYSFTVKP